MIDGVAVLSSGYESEEPEVIIPVKLAERLGFDLSFLKGTEVGTYEAAGEVKVRTYCINGCLKFK